MTAFKFASSSQLLSQASAAQHDPQVLSATELDSVVGGAERGTIEISVGFVFATPPYVVSVHTASTGPETLPWTELNPANPFAISSAPHVA